MIGRPQQYFWVKPPESSSNLMFKKSLEEVSAGVKISFEPIFWALRLEIEAYRFGIVFLFQRVILVLFEERTPN